MYKTNINNCNVELLEQQRQDLINEIVYGEPKKYFKVYALEAGTGKTRTAEFALAKMVNETNHNAILVRTFDKDCDESAKLINNMVGYEVALPYYNKGVTKETRYLKQKDFPKYRILIITHQRYLELSRNLTQKRIFINGRNTLVIDEYINDVIKLVLSMKRITTLKAILRFDSVLYNQYLKIIQPLEDTLLSPHSIRDYYRLRVTQATSINKDISELLGLIKVNICNDSLKQIIESSLILENQENLDMSFLNEITAVGSLCHKIEEIKEFYNQAVIMHDDALYAPDSRTGYWLLDKNIVLDAGADLQTAYTDRPKMFKVVRNEKVLDYSDWTLINVLANTITSSKERIDNFYDVVNKYLADNFNTDNMLVISNKKDINLITIVKEENRTYFGNLIGSNKWFDLKNVAIIQTPNVSDVDYLLKYLHYYRDTLDSTIFRWSALKTGRGLKSLYQFTDEEMESYREKFIAEQVYQAIKRVNRRMDGETKVVLMCNYERVVNLIRDSIQGCKFETVDEIGLNYMETKQEQYFKKLQDSSYANKFMILIAELQAGKHNELLFRDKTNNAVKGTYKKQKLREYMKINEKTIFSHQVLLNTRIIEYCKTRGILTKGQYIKLPQ